MLKHFISQAMAMKHYAIGVAVFNAVAVFLLAATQLPEAIEASKRNSCVDHYTKSSMLGGRDWVAAYTEAARLCN